MQKMELLRVLLVLLVVVSKVQSRARNPQPVSANVFFSRLPVENSSSQTDLKVLRSSHKEKIGTSKVRASAVIVKATLGLLAKPASFDVVHQEWRRTYGNVVGAVHEATKLGLQLSSKRYFESPRSLCRTSLQLGNSESFSMLHMFSRSVPHHFHISSMSEI